MKNVLKVFVLVLVVFCMVVSCSKKAGSSGSGGGSSNDADGSEVIASSNDTAGSGNASAGSGSTSAAGNDNTIRNVVGGIEHEKDDIVFFNWAGIPWTDFGLSAAPAEPSGGKFETAFLRSDKQPYIFISNVSKAAYEGLCSEMEAAFDKEGEINRYNPYDWYLDELKFDNWEECYEILLGTEMVGASALRRGSGEWEDSEYVLLYKLRIYYYGSPVNGIVMTIFSEAIL